MRISSLFYNLKQGLLNIWHNKMFSLASLATMTACIFLFGVFYSISVNFDAMVHNAEEGVAVTVYFDEDVTTSQMQEIGDMIAIRPEVSKYKFISADEAWETFKKEYFGDEHSEAADSFSGDNPLQYMANYEIYLEDVSQQKSLVDWLKSLDGVREVHQSEAVANTLTDFNSLIRFISGGIIIILIGVAVFLISNTVTVGISVRREEIAIMKLIGARDGFVRAPFIVEGIVIGLVGSVIPLALLFFLYKKIITYVAERFNALEGMFAFIPVTEVFRILVPVSLVLGVGIGYLGSKITLRRHLRV